MSGFAALMALSASQTRESENAVKSALIQRQRNAGIQRKKQEEQERKELEMAARLRQQHFDNEKRELERQQKSEEEQRLKGLARQKREQEQRDALRYGPKKSKPSGTSQWPTSNGSAKEHVRKRRMPSEDHDDDSTGGSAKRTLTREEKRERKMRAESHRAARTPKPKPINNGYTKAGGRLPGGAIDATASSVTPINAGSSTMSVKERLAALPNTLTKLNVVKRDVRTIDEILQDRAKAKGESKVLNGDKAREFNDWFGTSKKKELLKKATVRASVSAHGSGTDSPASPSPSSKSLYGTSTPPTKTNAARPSSSAIAKTPANVSKPSSLNPGTGSQPSTSRTVLPPKSKASVLPDSVSRSSYPSSHKKRPRSPSLSDSPPPRTQKKRAVSPNVQSSSFSAEIWKLFGKDRTAYTQMDVLSDDEDMEADALVLENEELRSTRVAKKEDQEALEAERRHEEAKRRRRREKELRQKPSQ